MRIIYLMLVLLIFISPTVSTYSQENVPVIPDPQSILAVSIENVEKLPIININDETQTLYYFSPEKDRWETYAYPDGLDEIKSVNGYISPRSNGTYLINTRGLWGFNPNLQDIAWIFDPLQGAFSRPPSVCNGWVQALEGEGEWIIIEDAENYRLCNTETGVESLTIPTVDEDYCPQGQSAITVSPDDKYVLFYCNGTQYAVYSYELATDTFSKLGDMSNERSDSIEIQWLNNHEAILHAYRFSNTPTNTYYTVNITQSTSLEFITSEINKGPFYYNNPPRLEWMPCEFITCGPEPDLGRLRVYDFTTHELTLLPSLDRVNGMSIPIPDGSNDRLYRSLNYVDDFPLFMAPTASLLRLNYDRLEVTELFIGEIEWIKSISPLGSYAALQMNNDSSVASNIILATEQTDYAPDGIAIIEIVDLESGDVVSHIEGMAWDNFQTDPMPLTWVNDNTFLIQGTAQYGEKTVLAQINDSVTVIRTFQNRIALSPSKNTILEINGNVPLSIYGISADQETTLIQDDPKFSISAYWTAEKQVIITLSEDDFIVARWLYTVVD